MILSYKNPSKSSYSYKESTFKTIQPFFPTDLQNTWVDLRANGSLFYICQSSKANRTLLLAVLEEIHSWQISNVSNGLLGEKVYLKKHLTWLYCQRFLQDCVLWSVVSKKSTLQIAILYSNNHSTWFKISEQCDIPIAANFSRTFNLRLSKTVKCIF